ncbi:MAG: hypothetical protein II399_04980 [Lachnospiraceae bacterium]|nr:hypothetical protein [Lachnospiraceae bacterium]
MENWFSVAVVICTIIFRWKVLAKTGEKGWKSLIPIYNEYLFAKKGDRVKEFKIYLVVFLVTLIASVTLIAVWMPYYTECLAEASTSSTNVTVAYLMQEKVGTPFVIFTIADMITGLALVILRCIMYIGLVEKFNKRSLLGVIMGVVPVAGFGVLALGNAQYLENNFNRRLILR